MKVHKNSNTYDSPLDSTRSGPQLWIKITVLLPCNSIRRSIPLSFPLIKLLKCGVRLVATLHSQKSTVIFNLVVCELGLSWLLVWVNEIRVWKDCTYYNIPVSTAQLIIEGNKHVTAAAALLCISLLVTTTPPWNCNISINQ